MHPLDNIIWQALTTRQAEFAESFDQARRFMPEVTSWSRFSSPRCEATNRWRIAECGPHCRSSFGVAIPAPPWVESRRWRPDAADGL